MARKAKAQALATVHKMTSEHLVTTQVALTVVKRAGGEYHALLTPTLMSVGTAGPGPIPDHIEARRATADDAVTAVVSEFLDDLRGVL